MYGLVCTRLHSYDVKVGVVASKYVETILTMPEMADRPPLEPDDVEDSRWSSEWSPYLGQGRLRPTQLLARMKLRTIGWIWFSQRLPLNTP
jgi:hypothetical protein